MMYLEDDEVDKHRNNTRTTELINYIKDLSQDYLWRRSRTIFFVNCLEIVGCLLKNIA